LHLFTDPPLCGPGFAPNRTSVLVVVPAVGFLHPPLMSCSPRKPPTSTGPLRFFFLSEGAEPFVSLLGPSFVQREYDSRPIFPPARSFVCFLTTALSNIFIPFSFPTHPRFPAAGLLDRSCWKLAALRFFPVPVTPQNRFCLRVFA